MRENLAKASAVVARFLKTRCRGGAVLSVATGVLLPALAACTGAIQGSGASETAAAPSTKDRDPESPPTPPSNAQCKAGVFPGPAPIRRLTPFEYNNTVRDLLGDNTNPANALPSEDLGNGFGNDAETLSVSSLLAEAHGRVAEGVAARATASATTMARYAPCAATVTAANEEACARTFILAFAPRAFRRPLETGEADELAALYKATRLGASFRDGLAAVIEGVLQSPDFLYRVEWGAADVARQVRRPTPHEMATRLSYFLTASAPDEALRRAADAGELATAQGVLSQAKRLLAEPGSRGVVRFFFDNYLPLSGLGALERDRARFPTYSSAVGAAMREESQRFLEHLIFEANADWPSVFTSGFTFLNEPLAKFYGVTGVTGASFRKTPVDGVKRLGLLTQAGLMAGTTHSSVTNPVMRGAFVAHKFLCKTIPLPMGEIAAAATPPNPDRAPTARQRYSEHSKNPVCSGCHQMMDPIGLTLENYDPVGLYRDKENGVTIDASGAIPGVDGVVNGPIDLARKLAQVEDVRACFAHHWMNFALGRTTGAMDKCSLAAVDEAFRSSGYNVQALLLAITQTDAFLHLPQ